MSLMGMLLGIEPTTAKGAQSPTGSYLGNTINPETADAFQAARNEQAVMGLIQGLGARGIGMTFGDAVTSGMAGMQQAQNALVPQALQAAQAQQALSTSGYNKAQTESTRQTTGLEKQLSDLYIDRIRNRSAGNAGTENSTGTPNFADKLPTVTAGDSTGGRSAVEAYYGKPISDDDYSALLRITHAEAGGHNNPQEQAMIMGSVINRAREHPQGIQGVLNARGQFQPVTGTVNSPGPSASYLQGPNDERKAAIESSAALLPSVPIHQKNFTAASSSAYGPGTNIGYRDKLISDGGVTYGGTVFNSSFVPQKPSAQSVAPSTGAPASSLRGDASRVEPGSFPPGAVNYNSKGNPYNPELNMTPDARAKLDAARQEKALGPQSGLQSRGVQVASADPSFMPASVQSLISSDPATAGVVAAALRGASGGAGPAMQLAQAGTQASPAPPSGGPGLLPRISGGSNAIDALQSAMTGGGQSAAGPIMRPPGAAPGGGQFGMPPQMAPQMAQAPAPQGMAPRPMTPQVAPTGAGQMQLPPGVSQRDFETERDLAGLSSLLKRPPDAYTTNVLNYPFDVSKLRAAEVAKGTTVKYNFKNGDTMDVPVQVHDAGPGAVAAFQTGGIPGFEAWKKSGASPGQFPVPLGGREYQPVPFSQVTADGQFKESGFKNPSDGSIVGQVTREPVKPDVVEAVGPGNIKGVMPYNPYRGQGGNFTPTTQSPIEPPGMAPVPMGNGSVLYPSGHPVAQDTVKKAEQGVLDPRSEIRKDGSVIITPGQGPAIASGLTKEITETRPVAQDAAYQLKRNNESRELLEKAYSGPGAEKMLQLQKLFQQLGIGDPKNAERIISSEAYLAARAKASANITKMMGPGAVSDYERQRNEAVAGARLDMNKGSLMKIIELDDHMSHQIIDEYNKNLDRAHKLDPAAGFPIFQVDKPPAYTPSAPAPKGIPLPPGAKKLPNGNYQIIGPDGKPQELREVR